jgi:hypothetical protein
MRSLFAALAAVAACSTGCYGPMYSQPYGYPAGSYGYPGPMNTLQPGQPYVPGGTMQSVPGSSLSPTPTYNNSGSAPLYNPPPGGPSATRPSPTYGDPNSPDYQMPESSGGNPLGFNTGTTLQRASAESLTTDPQPMNGGNPFALQPVPTTNSPAATADENFFESQDPADANYNKITLPPVPVAYQAATQPRPTNPPRAVAH